MSAFALGTLLVHDGEGGAEALSAADAGDDVNIQGDLHPFEGPYWESLQPFLSGATYVLEVEELDALVLVTALPADMPEGTVVVEGDLVHMGPHPDEAGRTVFVLEGQDVREPIVFR